MQVTKLLNAETAGSTNSAWVSTNNLRDDKAVVLFDWNGTGTFTIRVQASHGNGAAASWDIVLVSEELTNATYVNYAPGGSPGPDPFDIVADTTNNTVSFYVPKFPQMRVRLHAAGGGATMSAWLIE